METELLAGPQRTIDDSKFKARGGSYGELLSGEMNGFFAEQAARGNGYIFSSALAGVALLAATTTNNKMVIANPTTSGRVLYLQFIKYGRTAVGGTPLEGSIVYNKGNARTISISAGGGNDIVSYTAAAAINMRSDLADNSGMLFAPAVSVVTTAPTLWCASGIAQTADNGGTTVYGPQVQNVKDEIWGAIQVWPGTYFSIGSAVTIVTTYTISVFALSLPVPLLSIP